ncbi:MAG: filamentous hemagglutinin N-terminal domain-containing protein, partial [Verrucomicrobiota bacterium]
MSLLSKFRNSGLSRVLVLGLLVPAAGLFSVPTLHANPSGANVVHGGVSFQGLGSNNLIINQSTGMAIINWQSFSIAAGQSTTFVQPNASAVALNRVVGGDPSAIYGALNANGGVMLINTNGILVGPSGTIDIGGMLTLSTLDITNEDFLNGGSNRFYGDSLTGVTNYGAISSADGDVVVIGGFVHNNGSIGALNGNVAIGAGGDFLVNQTVNGSTISVQGASDYDGEGIRNDGTIEGSSSQLMTHGNVF